MAGIEKIEDLRRRIEELEGEAAERDNVEKKYRSLFSHSNDAIFVHDLQGHIIDINKKGEEMFGFTKSEMLSMKIPDLHPPEFLQISKWAFQKISEDGQVKFETRFLKKDGETFLAEVSSSLLVVGGEQVIQGIVRDITAKKRMENSLRASEEQYRALFDKNSSVMLLIDPETGNIIDGNPSACTYYGYPKPTLTKMKITEINMLSEKEVFEEMNKARTEERKYFNFRHRLSDGDIRDVEVYTGPISVKGKALLCSIIHDISDRKVAEREREALIIELQKALSEVKTLRGFLPICAFCKKIRDDTGYWKQIETYIREHSDAEFSHGICPDCAKKIYPDF